MFDFLKNKKEPDAKKDTKGKSGGTGSIGSKPNGVENKGKSTNSTKSSTGSTDKVYINKKDITDNSNNKSYLQLIEKAKKLKALAKDGDVGEKGNAEVFYKEFIEKHNINEEDVEPSHYNRVFRLKNFDYEVILSHMIVAVNPYIRIDRKNREYHVVLDDEDYTEVIERVNFYYAAFKREKEFLFMAFMDKFRGSFAPDEKAVLKHSETARKMQEEAEKLYKNMSTKTYEAPSNKDEAIKSKPKKEKKEDVPPPEQEEEVPNLSPKEQHKIQIYQNLIDMVRYVKSNRQLKSKS